MPERIQRKRVAGWKAPVGAKYVGRGSKYGNPWSVLKDGDAWIVQWTGHNRLPAEYAHPHNGAYRVTCAYQTTAHEESVRYYRDWLRQVRRDLVQAARTELAGHDLLCWCGTGVACHGDPLLAVAAGEEP